MLQSKHYKLLASLLFVAGHLPAVSGAAVPQGPVLARKVSLSIGHPAPPPMGSVLSLRRSASAPAAPARPASALTVPVLPTLNWQQRSDWVNVKTSVQPGAVGDGINDDTAAIQAALNQIQDGFTNYDGKIKTVYLPAGTYKITKTLVLTNIFGGMIVGCGQGTRLVWAGAPNQPMYRSNGVTWSRYVGLTWDGRGIASAGIDHQASTRFEFRIRHQDEAFLNFRAAGIREGYNQICSTSEVLYRNCIFQNCENGIALLDYNDYDNDVDGCFFQDCGTAINCDKGNVYVRDCNFQQSRVTDLYLFPHSHSVRRCTSVGSNQFLATPYCYTGCEVTLEDCRIDGWTGKAGAISFSSRGPDTIVDCVFTHPPDALPPIRMNNPGDSMEPVTLCNDSAPSSPCLVAPAANVKIVTLPAGQRGGNLTGLNRVFLKSVEDVSGKVFDVKTMFGAKGDGVTNDTAAILSAIADAKKQGNGAIVYFPPGFYMVSSTLPINGGRYKIEGGGITSQIIWCGDATGPVFSVQDPQDITLSQMRISAPNANVALVEQTSATDSVKSMMTYDCVYAWSYTNSSRGIELVGLPALATVHFGQMEGNTHLHDCSRATVLADASMGGVIKVDGADYDRSGFLGFLMRYGYNSPSDFVIQDNQNMVVSNYYCESTQASLNISGNGAYAGQPGHVTVQGTRNHTFTPPIVINDYEGRVSLMSALINGPVPHTIIQTGQRPVDIVLFGNNFTGEEPVFQLGEGAHLTTIQNIMVSDETSFVHVNPDILPGLPALNTAKLLSTSATSTSAGSPLDEVTAALDDFRQLGAVDLAINHP